jgi:hypothetical protein
MFEELPQVHFSEVITASGEIQVDHETAPVARFRLSRNKHDLSSPWEFEIFVAEESRGEFDRTVKRRSYPKFTGTSSDGHTIEIPELRWRSWSSGSGSLTGVVWEVLIDPDTTLPMKPHRQMVNISLSHTSLAISEKRFLMRSYTGEIKEEASFSSEPEQLLYWDTAHGRMTLACYYDYEHARVGESQSLVQIPVSSLRLQLPEEAITSDPRRLADTIAQDIAGPLRLLSYLSRSHVHWTSIRVSSEFKDADRRLAFHQLQRLRAGALGDDRSNRDWGLANPYNMAPDGLNRMVTTLQASPYREVLLTAMVYLVTGYDTGVPESSLVSSFTALETITNGIGGVDGTDQILTAGAFKRLKKHLESAIQSHVKDQGLSADLVPPIVRKLGELNRLAITPRVCALIERYNVDWRDLWPDDPLEVGVQKMFKVRNAFVHQGHIDMKGRAYIAARRAHILGERLIWQILGGQRQWEDIRTYPKTDHLRALEKELDEEEKAGSDDAPANAGQ